MKNDKDEICFEFGPPRRVGVMLVSCLGIGLLLRAGWNVIVVQQRSVPIFVWPVIVILLLLMLVILLRNLFFKERLVVQRFSTTRHAGATIVQCADIVDVTVEQPPLYQSARWSLDWFGFGKGLLVIHTKQEQIILGPGTAYEKAITYQDQILAFCGAERQGRPQAAD